MQARPNENQGVSPRWLITIRSPSGVSSIETQKDRLVIGSLISADIRLDMQGVAPIHAVIEMDSSGASVGQIYDLASETGLKVDGQTTPAGTLRNGSSVEVAGALIQFSKVSTERPIPEEALLLVSNDAQVQSIFDPKPSLAQSLEVVCSWNDTILQVKHFQNEEFVRLGDASESDFVVPLPEPLGKSFILATQVLGQWTLKLNPSFQAVLFSGGRVQTLEKKSLVIQLQAGDFARLKVGSLTFYVSKTQAPPRLIHRGGISLDPLLLRSLLVSAAITIGAFVGVSRMEPQQSIEAEQLPERVVTILYQPEVFQKKQEVQVVSAPPTPPPMLPERPMMQPAPAKKLPRKKFVQKQSASGAGQRALGRQGKRGETKAPPRVVPQRVATRVSQRPSPGRGGGKSRADDQANVQMLKGASTQILDLLGGSSEKLGKAGNKLKGFGGFSTQGSGGLALSGSGKGGGGNAKTLLGGVGTKGRAGGKVGTGLGSSGTGRGIIGGRTRVALQTGDGEETIILGSIDREAVQAAINARRDEFRYCYEREINTGSAAGSGRVTTTFTIGSSGRASQLGIVSTSLNMAKVERCVLEVLSRIQFPKTIGGGFATITYPFEFNSAK
jgi:hypothetical protein